MKKLYIISILCLLPLAVFAHLKGKYTFRKDTITVNSARLSNNPGNIISDGLIVSDNEHIYYVSTSSDDGLYSMKIDGTDVQKLSSDNIEFLNISNGWLYYCKSGSNQKPNIGGLYKMKSDGTQEQRLMTDGAFYINVINDWIYYVNWSYSTDICRIKTDGTNRQVLYAGHYQCLTTDGNNLYFGMMAGPGTSILYRGTLDGGEIKKLSKDTVDNFFVYGNWIYYRKHSSNICRMNKSNYKNEELYNNENFLADSIVPDNGSLYLAGDAGIIKFNIQKRNAETLFRTRVIQFGFASNYVYFTTAKWDKNNVRHTKSYLMTLDKLKSLAK